MCWYLFLDHSYFLSRKSYDCLDKISLVFNKKSLKKMVLNLDKVFAWWINYITFLQIRAKQLLMVWKIKKIRWAGLVAHLSVNLRWSFLMNPRLCWWTAKRTTSYRAPLYNLWPFNNASCSSPAPLIINMDWVLEDKASQYILYIGKESKT